MKFLSHLLFAAGVLALSSTGSNIGAMAQEGNSRVKTYVVEGNFEDAIFDLGEALINKGLVIDDRNKVAEMLKRTGKDLGETKVIYKGGEVLSFCSARLSRNAMEADPINMAFCPYTMFAYETIVKPGFVTVGYMKIDGASSPASKKALDAVNKLMDEMVREAAGLE